MKALLRTLGALHGRLVHSRRVRVLAAQFVQLIPSAHSVLDVGCGDGLIDALILAERPDLKLSGVDVRVRRDARISVRLFDGRTLPFPDHSWDTVLLCDVLHHTERPLDLLKEAVRVARHSLIIKDHLVDGVLARLTLDMMDLAGNAPHGVVSPCNYFTFQQWEDAYRECGLVPHEVRRRLRLYPWWADVLFGRSLHFIASFHLAHGA